MNAERERELEDRIRDADAQIEQLQSMLADSLDKRNGKYLIWSAEHNAWWAYGRRGYTLDRLAAGKYSLTEAIEITKDANVRVDAHGLPPEETMHPV